MSLFEPAGTPSTPHYPAQGYAGDARHAGDVGYAAPGPELPAPFTAPMPYGPEQPHASPPPEGISLPRGFGESLLAAGGLLFFIASFLTWVSVRFDFGVDLGDICSAITEPNLRVRCEQASAASADAVSTNAWDLGLTAAATAIMILLTAAAACAVAKLIPSVRATRTCFAAGLVIVDVVVLIFFGVYDFSMLGTALTADSFGPATESVARLGSGFSLGVGFWLAVVGLVVAHVGLGTAHLVSRRDGPRGS